MDHYDVNTHSPLPVSLCSTLMYTLTLIVLITYSCHDPLLLPQCALLLLLLTRTAQLLNLTRVFCFRLFSFYYFFFSRFFVVGYDQRKRSGLLTLLCLLLNLNYCWNVQIVMFDEKSMFATLMSFFLATYYEWVIGIESSIDVLYMVLDMNWIRICTLRFGLVGRGTYPRITESDKRSYRLSVSQIQALAVTDEYVYLRDSVGTFLDLPINSTDARRLSSIIGCPVSLVQGSSSARQLVSRRSMCIA